MSKNKFIIKPLKKTEEKKEPLPGIPWLSGEAPRPTKPKNAVDLFLDNKSLDIQYNKRRNELIEKDENPTIKLQEIQKLENTAKNESPDVQKKIKEQLLNADFQSQYIMRSAEPEMQKKRVYRGPQVGYTEEEVEVARSQELSDEQLDYLVELEKVKGEFEKIYRKKIEAAQPIKEPGKEVVDPMSGAIYTIPGKEMSAEDVARDEALKELKDTGLISSKGYNRLSSFFDGIIPIGKRDPRREAEYNLQASPLERFFIGGAGMLLGYGGTTSVLKAAKTYKNVSKGVETALSGAKKVDDGFTIAGKKAGETISSTRAKFLDPVVARPIAELSGKAAQSAQTFTSYSALDVIGEDLPVSEKAERILGSAFLGGGLGSTGVISSPFKRIPAEGLVGFTTGILETGDPKEATINALLFMGFGLINRRNIKRDEQRILYERIGNDILEYFLPQIKKLNTRGERSAARNFILNELRKYKNSNPTPEQLRKDIQDVRKNILYGLQKISSRKATDEAIRKQTAQEATRAREPQVKKLKESVEVPVEGEIASISRDNLVKMSLNDQRKNLKKLGYSETQVINLEKEDRLNILANSIKPVNFYKDGEPKLDEIKPIKLKAPVEEEVEEIKPKVSIKATRDKMRKQLFGKDDTKEPVVEKVEPEPQVIPEPKIEKPKPKLKTKEKPKLETKKTEIAPKTKLESQEETIERLGFAEGFGDERTTENITIVLENLSKDDLQTWLYKKKVKRKSIDSKKVLINKVIDYYKKSQPVEYPYEKREPGEKLFSEMEFIEGNEFKGKLITGDKNWDYGKYEDNKPGILPYTKRFPKESSLEEVKKVVSVGDVIVSNMHGIQRKVVRIAEENGQVKIYSKYGTKTKKTKEGKIYKEPDNTTIANYAIAKDGKLYNNHQNNSNFTEFHYEHLSVIKPNDKLYKKDDIYTDDLKDDMDSYVLFSEVDPSISFKERRGKNNVYHKSPKNRTILQVRKGDGEWNDIPIEYLHHDDAEVAAIKYAKGIKPIPESVKIKESKTKPEPKASVEAPKKLDVVDISPKDIKIDESKFQPREDYNQSVIDNVAENYDAVKWNEPILWKDESGDMFVVSGHHRVIGSKKANYPTISVKLLPENTTLEQAKDYAGESNAGQAPQSDFAFAKTVREKLDRGDKALDVANKMPGVFSKAKTDASKKSAVHNLATLAYLDSNGKLKQNYEATNEFPRIISISKFVGGLRKKHDFLTDRHEDDIFTHLYTENAIKGDIDDFYRKIDNIIERMESLDDKPASILKELRKEPPKVNEGAATEIKDKAAELEKHIDNLNRQLSDKKIIEDLIRVKKQDYDNKIKKVELFEKVKSDIKEQIKIAKQELKNIIDLSNKTDESQTSIFESMKQLNIFGGVDRVKTLDTRQKAELETLYDELIQINKELEQLSKQQKNKQINTLSYNKQYKELQQRKVQAEKEKDAIVKDVPEVTNNQLSLSEKTPVSSQINTPAFKNWFKKSKIVDSNGKPLVVYHGTTQNFDTFRQNIDRSGFGEPGQEIYLTDDPKYASRYATLARENTYPQGAMGKVKKDWSKIPSGANVLPVYVSMQNPKLIINKGTNIYYSKKQIAKMKKEGYDGVILFRKSSLDKLQFPEEFSKVMEGEQSPPPNSFEEIIAFEPTQIKSAIGNKGVFGVDNPNIIMDSTKRLPNFSNIAFKNWFKKSKVVDKQGKPLVVYHGTQRPDRVGDKFRKDRAMSGSMAYFTDNPEMASGYATSKKDQSIDVIGGDISLYKVNGVKLKDAWSKLSYSEKQAFNDKAWKIGNNWDAKVKEGEPYPLTFDKDYRHISKNHYDFMLNDPREGNGNGFVALHNAWIGGGEYVYEEHHFVKVLEKAGLKNVDYFDPRAIYPSVYPVHLSIQKPLKSNAIPQKIIKGLEKESKNQTFLEPTPYTDHWDKERVDPKDWIEMLKYDMERYKKTPETVSGSAFTSIPDWVTNYLKKQGYDGIQDVGGTKLNYSVFIPFEPTQIKSAIGNRGTFDPSDASIIRDNSKRLPNFDATKKPFRENATQEQKDLTSQLRKELSEPNPRGTEDSGAWSGLGAGYTIRGNAITKPLREKGFIDLVGTKVKTYHDLAMAAQVLRDPRYETLRIFYVKDGKVLHQNAISNRLPGAVMGLDDVSGKDLSVVIKEGMSNTKADGYYMMHNHPSGFSSPSKADIEHTLIQDREVKGFLGHIIINSGEYTLLSKVPNKNSLDVKTTTFGVFPNDPLLTPSKSHEYLGRDLSNVSETVKIAKELEHNGYFTIIGTDVNNKIRGVVDVPFEFFNGKLADQQKRLQDIAVHTGSHKIISIVDADSGISPWHLTTLNQLNVTDSMSDIIVKQGHKITGYAEHEPRALTYGQKGSTLVAEKDKSPRRKALARAHILENEIGLTDDERRTYKKVITGYNSLGEASDTEIASYIDWLLERKHGSKPIKQISATKKKTLKELAAERKQEIEEDRETILQRASKVLKRPIDGLGLYWVYNRQSMQRTLEKMGDGGNNLLRMFKEADYYHSGKVKPVESRMEKLWKKVPSDEKEIMKKIIESNGASDLSEGGKEFLRFWKDITNDIYVEGKKYINEDLNFIDNYFPLSLKPEIYNDMNPQHPRWDEVVDHVQKIISGRISQGNVFDGYSISKEETEKYIIDFLANYKKQGLRQHFIQQVFEPTGNFKHSYPLELHRDRIFPEWAYVNDVMDIAHAYIDKSYEAIGYAKEFGKMDEEYKYENIDKELEIISADGYDHKLAANIMGWSMGLKRQDIYDETFNKVARSSTTFLLTPRTTLKNITDLGKAFSQSGARNTLYALAKLYVARNKKDRQLAHDLIGSKYVFAQSLEKTGIGAKAASFYADNIILFTRSERAVRETIGFSRILQAEQLLKNYDPEKSGMMQGHIKRLFNLSTDGLDIDVVKARGYFTRNEKFRIGNNAIGATQPTSTIDKPFNWASKGFWTRKSIFQSFSHRSIRWLKDFVLEETKKGNMFPMVNLILWRLALGYGYKEASDWMWNKEPKEEETKMKKAWGIMLETGEIGIIGDLLFAVQHSGWANPFISILFGPKYSLMFETLMNFGQTANRAINDKENPLRPIKRQAARMTIKRIPFVGQQMYDENFGRKKKKLKTKKAPTGRSKGRQPVYN